MYLGRRRASGFFGVLEEGCVVIKGYAILHVLDGLAVGGGSAL